MSGTRTVFPDLPAPPRPAPLRPQAPLQLPEQTLAWGAEFFRERGWKSNTVRNQALKGTLDTAAKGLLRPGGPDSAAALAAEKLEPGTEFKIYLRCLDAFERSPNPIDAASLKAASANYIKHYGKHSDRQKKEKATLRKFHVCQETAADIDLWIGVHGLGDMPWDSKTAMKAATMKAELDLASLPSGGQTVESLDGKGQNPTFWVNRAGTDPATKDKSYLFKPATDKVDRIGVPKGGEPAREALTGRAADILNGMTGIDFKVPETHIVTVQRKRFEGIKLSNVVVDFDGDTPLVGSLQQFARSEGELRENSPTAAAAVPPERCQELAILDIVTMHVDRHSGNFMLTGDDAGADLVPIDNGLSFPDKPLELTRMATAHNALLRLPGSHKPFTPEMLKKIVKIDPDALKAALKNETGDIAAVHPSAAGKVSDAALEQSRRAAMFLKLAAPRLTPAVVQVALGQNAERLFDTVAITDDAAFTIAATQIINAMVPQQGELAEYFQMSLVEQIRLEDECKRLGWDARELSPAQVLKIFKAQAQRAAAPKTPTGGGPMTDPEKIAMRLAFPNAPKTPGSNAVDAWRALARLGTPAQIKALVERAAGQVSSSMAKGAALNTPDAALDLIQAQAAANAVPPAADAVGKRLLVESKRRLIKEVATMLPDTVQRTASQGADTLQTIEGLDKLRDKVFGEVREILSREYRSLLEKVAKLEEGQPKNTAQNALSDAKKYISVDFNLLEAKKALDEVTLP